MIAVGDRLTSWGGGAKAPVLAVVSFADPTNSDSARQLSQISTPVLMDTDRSTYRAYGLGRGTLWDVWGPRTVRRYAQIYRQRGWSRREPATEDTMQLGGDVVVGPDGRIVFAYRGKGPWDRPAIDDLVAAVTSAQ